MRTRTPFPSLTLLGALMPADVDRLLGVSREQQVISGHLAVRAGGAPSAVFIVLEGLMEVVSPRTSEVLATLGPGEIFGEMGYVRQQPASADVRARENSLLLVIGTAELDALSVEDPPLGMRVHRALAATLAARLRVSNERLDRALALRPDAGTPDEIDAVTQLFARITDMKAELVAVDRAALKADGIVAEATATVVREAFTSLVHEMNAVVSALDDEPQRSRVGARLQAELLPYVLLSDMGERMYAKPRGYAGDYLTIAQLYADVSSGSGRLGPLLDRCLRDQSAGSAVRNRRPLLAEEIGRAIAGRAGQLTRVTSLACGPAQELFDVFASLDDPAILQATCLDIDAEALAYVRARLDDRFAPCVCLEQANLVYLALGRTTLDLPPQHLMYSIGLIDYFNDRFVVNLLNFIHGCLAPGGQVILGNFHPSNPTRALMDEVLDWPLIHRSEDDMHRLCAQSAFGRPCDRIRFDPSGVNLFAIASRR